MHQPVAMEMPECFGERETDFQDTGGREAAVLQIGAESVRDVEIRSPKAETRRKPEARHITLLRNGGGFGIRISDFFRYSLRIFERVSQLHYVIEVSLGLVAANVEQRELARMPTGDAFELLDPLELPLEWPVLLESVAPNDFRRSQHASGPAPCHPYLSIGA